MKTNMRYKFLISYFPLLFSFYLIFTKVAWYFDLLALISLIILVRVDKFSSYSELPIGVVLLLMSNILIKLYGFRQTWPILLISFALFGLIVLYYYYKINKTILFRYGFFIGAMLILFFMYKNSVWFIPIIEIYFSHLLISFSFLIPLLLLGKILKKNVQINSFVYLMGLIPFWYEIILPGGFEYSVYGWTFYSLTLKSMIDLQITIPLLHKISYLMFLSTCFFIIPVIAKWSKSNNNVFLLLLSLIMVNIDIYSQYLLQDSSNTFDFFFSGGIISIVIIVCFVLQNNDYPNLGTEISSR